MTTPFSSHSDSWRGVSLSLIAIPTGAFLLAKHPGESSRFFVYGVGSSLLFVQRWVNMDRFHLWLLYRAPDTPILAICWILFALGMGTVCWFTAKLRERSNTERSDEWPGNTDDK
jgi:hypothetical protein